MALAARKPQVSTPTDTLGLIDILDIEDDSFIFATWVPTGLLDELDTDFLELLVGKSDYIEVADELTIEDNLFHFYLRNIELSTELDVEVYQNFTEQLIAEQEISSSDAVGRLDNLELDLVLSSTNPSFFKEFTYSGESLTGYNVYVNASKTTQLYSVVFLFSGEDLISKTITRISDGKVLIVGFNYSSGNLVSQTRTLT